MISKDKNWFALYTKPRSEFSAERQLQVLGVQYFLPTITNVRQWSDRKKKITEPLFRGYIFIHTNEKERLQAVKVSSVIRCIFAHGRPAVIPEWQIENVKRMLKLDLQITVQNEFTPGKKILINDGPLRGMIGVVVNSKRGKSIAVSIDLLHRSISTLIPDSSILKFI